MEKMLLSTMYGVILGGSSMPAMNVIRVIDVLDHNNADKFKTKNIKHIVCSNKVDSDIITDMQKIGIQVHDNIDPVESGKIISDIAKSMSLNYRIHIREEKQA